VSYSDHKIVLRNYEGYITTYEEPLQYEQHDKHTCASCQSPRPEPGQGGIHGLLQGDRMWIEPRGFEEIHTRGADDQHRLKDPSKWVPYGVGAIEGQAAEAPRRLPVLGASVAAPEANGNAKPVYAPGEEPIHDARVDAAASDT
jgi:hypothetical protein